MSRPDEDLKRIAARAALDELPHDGVVGLGSGSTSRIFAEELAARMAGRRIATVPTSEAVRALATSLGIPLLDDEGPWTVDVTVDGADEVSAALDLVKGGGGALTREKIVDYASRRNVIIVDPGKLSTRLGEKHAVPVEVLAFAHRTTHAHLERLGRATLRMQAGAPARTDAGNVLYDVTTGPIDDPASLDRALRAIPGVVETGLFIGRADVVIVGEIGGARRLVR